MSHKLQELMTTGGANSTMIEKEIYNTVVNAARANLVGTQVLALRIPPSGIPGASIDIDLADKNSMAVSKVGEGAELPIDFETVSSFNIKPVKYGVRPLVTKEMVEDNKFPVIQRNLAEAGYQMAKALDTDLFAQLAAGNSAASQTVTGGGTITVGNISAAMNFLETNDFTPTDAIFHPAVAQDLRTIALFAQADQSGINNAGKNLIGTIFGMRVWVSSQVPKTTTGTNAGDVFVIDRNNALVLAEKRPITVEQYNDVTRDLSGVAVTARWGMRYLRSQAISRITLT